MTKPQKSSEPAAPTADLMDNTASPEIQPSPSADSPARKTKVRILRDCVYGVCDDVVLIDSDLVESLAGVVDADPAAVSYAESLK